MKIESKTVPNHEFKPYQITITVETAEEEKTILLSCEGWTNSHIEAFKRNLKPHVTPA